jgi:hypothetical protein
MSGTLHEGPSTFYFCRLHQIAIKALSSCEIDQALRIAAEVDCVRKVAVHLGYGT